MGTVITPYTEEWTGAVLAFNDRLRAGGSVLFFPESHVPAWLPKIEGRPIYHEYYLATDGDEVRGGYMLKWQPFFAQGRQIELAQYRLPLSEGQVDSRYASVGVQLYLDATRKGPLLYTIGLGGYQEAVTQMLIAAGWNTHLVPFYFRVLRPANFLRNIVYLRNTPFRRAMLDVLAATGLGTLGVHALQAVKTRGKLRDDPAITCSEEPEFAAWADEIWESARGDYAMLAVRDVEILNILYPADDPRWIRLKVSFNGEVVGWASLLNVPMEGHNYFGDMRVGSLVDCLARRGMENKVTLAAMRYFRRRGADVVVANMLHHRWCRALEDAGLYRGPSNYIFATSKKVATLLGSFDEQKQNVHMTRGDGSGAENLLSASNKFPVPARHSMA